MQCVSDLQSANKELAMLELQMQLSNAQMKQELQQKQERIKEIRARLEGNRLALVSFPIPFLLNYGIAKIIISHSVEYSHTELLRLAISSTRPTLPQPTTLWKSSM